MTEHLEREATSAPDTEILLDRPLGAGAPVPNAELVAVTPTTEDIQRISRRRLVLRRFLRNKLAVIGVLVYLVLILFAMFGSRLSKWSYAQIDRKNYLKAPSSEHWFGTTQAGRDVFAMTVHGLQKSILIGLAVALASTTVAAIIGSFAAYFGGFFERVSLWVVDLLLVLPSFLIIAVLMRSHAAQGGGTWLLIFLLAAFNWMLSARIVRSLTQSVKDRDYVQAAKYMGVRGPKIIFRHILPNIASLLIIDATLNVAGAVLSETALSFFGFGIQSPDTSLGTLIADGQTKATTFEWIFLFPSAFLVVMVMAVNFIGDGLRDALDPTSLAAGTA